MQFTADEAAAQAQLERARRRFEDALTALGRERDWLEHHEIQNRQKVRALLVDARAVGITLADIATLTGISRQTLYAWMSPNMTPIPAVHFGLAGPPPSDLDETILRTMGERAAADRSFVAGLAALHPRWDMSGDRFTARDRHHSAVRRRLSELAAIGVLSWRVGTDDDGEERRTEIALQDPPPAPRAGRRREPFSRPGAAAFPSGYVRVGRRRRRHQTFVEFWRKC